MSQSVKVLPLIEKINMRNRLSLCDSGPRSGWNSLLEDILMEAKVYAGFGYLGKDEVPEGQQPGITWKDEDRTEPATFPDESRRFYYIHRSLKPIKVGS